MLVLPFRGAHLRFAPRLCYPGNRLEVPFGRDQILVARLVANDPDSRDREQYRQKMRQIVDDNDPPDSSDVIFIEVTATGPSEFASLLDVRGQVLHAR